jgi:hypothetical protein
MACFFQRLAKLAVAALVLGALAVSAAPPDSTEIMPVSQVRAGMQGYAYTIFAGDQIEKFDLEVLGVLPNFLGPKQSIILVQLKGPKVEHTGVVAGMSGSPVYLEGKLAGALSLKLGIFTKEAIAGVTPIEDVLRPPTESAAAQANPQQFSLPNNALARNTLPSGSSLEPIETPLVFSGFQPGRCSNLRRNCRVMDLWRHRGARPKRGRRMVIWWPGTWLEWCWCKATRPSMRRAR